MNGADNYAGGMLISNSRVVIRSGAFRNCNAYKALPGSGSTSSVFDGYGGGLLVSDGVALLVLYDVAFGNCSAEGYGGGLFWYGNQYIPNPSMGPDNEARSSISGGSFTSCSATKGGAMFVQGSPNILPHATQPHMTLTSVSWSHNEASYAFGDPGHDLYMDTVDQSTVACVPGCSNAGMRMRDGGCEYPVTADASFHGGAVSTCASTCASASSDCAVCGRWGRDNQLSPRLALT